MNNTLVSNNCTFHVCEYEKHLYIDTQHNILFFSTQEIKPIAVGYLLDGKITPLTEELKEIVSGHGSAIPDTHFDEQLNDNSDSDSDSSSNDSDDNVAPKVYAAPQTEYSNVIKVREYDVARHLYIEEVHNLLIFSKQGESIIVGFILNDEIKPLTEELKTIIAKDYHGIKISDTHFDEKL